VSIIKSKNLRIKYPKQRSYYADDKVNKVSIHF